MEDALGERVAINAPHCRFLWVAIAIDGEEPVASLVGFRRLLGYRPTVARLPTVLDRIPKGESQPKAEQKHSGEGKQGCRQQEIVEVIIAK